MSVTVRGVLSDDLGAAFADVCRLTGLKTSPVVRMLVCRWVSEALRDRQVVLTLDEAAEKAKEKARPNSPACAYS